MIYLNQLYSVILYNKEISFHIIVIILVMAAIPPFSSFFAKFLIFIASIEVKFELITIVLLGFTLISTFYYLNFIQQLIFFKVKDLKIFIFKYNILYFYFLRLNTFLFSFSFLILSSIYEIGGFLLLFCL
jgi:NADH:ubiquinone oxidoreductase subunit 2 (subunit N)